MRPLRRVAIVLWILVFLVGGFLLSRGWLSAPPEPGATAATTAAPAPTTEGATPDKLAAFTLADLKGQPRSSNEWAGRTVLYNFWATWCAPCRQEMPLLEQFATDQAAGPDGVAVVGVAIDRLEPVLRFVGETGVTYPVLVGQMDATRVAESFGDAFKALPFSVVVAPDGTVLTAHTGELKLPDLTRIATISGKLRRGELGVADARAALVLGQPESPAGS